MLAKPHYPVLKLGLPGQSYIEQQPAQYARRKMFLGLIAIVALQSMVLLSALQITAFFNADQNLVKSMPEYGAMKIPNRKDLDDEIFSNGVLPLCPAVSPNLKGPMEVFDGNTTWYQAVKWLESTVKPGGFGKPEHCRTNESVAIIIPYRNRERHLRVLLTNLHPLLRRQQIDYGIFVVEQQSPRNFFNRAKLINVGYTEALKLMNFTCLIFHDVDHVPMDDRILYKCSDQPRHMSVAVDRFDYKLPYHDMFGGVSAMKREHFEKVNGYANSYWGWGGEDDDMSRRITFHGMNITRRPASKSKFKTLTHNREKPNGMRWRVLRASKYNFGTDGLNSLKYKLETVELKALYTWILVDLQKPAVNKTAMVQSPYDYIMDVMKSIQKKSLEDSRKAMKLSQ